MPGLVPGIHDLLIDQETKTWMAGTSPAMTNTINCDIRLSSDENPQNHTQQEAGCIAMDRILIATARELAATLVTRDRTIVAYGARGM